MYSQYKISCTLYVKIMLTTLSHQCTVADLLRNITCR